MIQIPDESILLAPGALHLSLYDMVHRQKGNCLNIQIFSVETYIRTLLPQAGPSEIETLYACQAALRALPETNSFSASRADLDFLKACLRFLKLAALYGIERFPETTRKERDLNEVLTLLGPVPLGVPTRADLEAIDVPYTKIFILPTEWTFEQSYWIDFLLAHGARLLENETKSEPPVYLSCANARKQMEIVADRILERRLPATDVFVALADPGDQEVLAQIFDAHRIPYTLLRQPQTTTVPDRFLAGLRYLRQPDKETYLALIQALYPEESAPVVRYLNHFDGIELDAIPYEDNALISERRYLTWQQEELDAKAWMESHRALQAWTRHDVEALAAEIQATIPEPTEEDLNAFDTIVQNYASIASQIETGDDFSLFIQFLERASFAQTAQSLSGVLVGTRQEISPLRPTTFFLGAHAKVFPALSMYSGIFDESFLAHTTFPPLKERLNKQRQAIFSTLGACAELTIIVPQSDYAGKSLEASAELESWVAKRPTFVNIPDVFATTVPGFDLDPGQAQSLFFKNGRHTTTFSKVSTFEQCPLRYYLRYGLALNRPKTQDDIRVDGSLLSRVLQRARTLRNATFAELTRDQIRSLVAEEFAFAKKIFPSRTAAFDSLIVEYGARIHDLISTLEIFEDRLHLALLNKEYELDQGFGWKDVSVEMKGPIEKYDPMKVSFLVVDPALEEAGIFDDKGGLGVFDLSLKQHAVPQSAFKVNYRTTQPDAIEISETQKNDEVSLQRFVDGWAVQDLPPAAQDPLLEKVLKKVPTYTEKEEKMQSKVEQALERLAQGDILPVHEKSACVYCPYKIICRNGASTKEKGERA